MGVESMAMRKALKAAEASGKYMVSISWVSDAKGTITHNLTTNEYKTADVMPTLEHYVDQYIGQTAEAANG